MADTGVVDLDAGAVVEMRGRDRPRGSKNKSKVAPMVVSSCAPVNQRPGRPLGSKNKTKSSASPSNETQILCAAILLHHLLEMYFIFSQLLVLNVVSNIACL
jgi:hypothetical protein